MSVRRGAVLVVLAVLLSGAGLAVWRSVAEPEPNDPDQVAAGLRCLTCEGETVADSPSPVAAAMREVIASQLAAGRTPDQVRDWFAQRYGPEILADPPAHGVGALLWVLPTIAVLTGLAVAGRTVLRRRAPPGTRDSGTEAEPPGPSDRRATRTWYLVAFAVVAMVAAVAAAGNQIGRDERAAAGTPASQVTQQLTLGRQLERQGDFAAAAEAYRTATQLRPDPRIRLHLAFALIRAARPGEAATVASDVLADEPANSEALLLLGLAQRAEQSPEATPTLRRFLRLAPDHPAAPEIRRLLGDT